MVIHYKGIFKCHKKLIKYDQNANIYKPQEQEYTVDSKTAKTVYTCMWKFCKSLTTPRWVLLLTCLIPKL